MRILQPNQTGCVMVTVLASSVVFLWAQATVRSNQTINDGIFFFFGKHKHHRVSSRTTGLLRIRIMHPDRTTGKA